MPVWPRSAASGFRRRDAAVEHVFARLQLPDRPADASRTSDGEVSWDQPGPLFDREQPSSPARRLDAFNTPMELRTVLGHIVACPTIRNTRRRGARRLLRWQARRKGSLVVYNPPTASLPMAI